MESTGTNSRIASVLLELDRDSPEPLHRQVEAGIRDAIRAGRLAHHARMPSSRALAHDLDVSRGVVIEAYQQLTSEGYLAATQGGYTHVASSEAPPPPPAPAPRERPAIDMLYGRPDVNQFPRDAWARSARRMFSAAPHERLIYLDGAGTPELRSALAEHLTRTRGAWAVADNVIVTVGFAQAFHLASTVLFASGARRLAVEDPSYDDVRPVAAAAGLEIIGIPVDHDGLDVDALAHSAADAVLVTPAHQLTGAVMPPERRRALAEWARRSSAIIIEDDYDSDFRYDHEPIGALQGLAPDQVLYAGSASKTLAPGLRLGWLVAPSRMVADLAAAKIDADRGSSVFDQLTFADFLRNGDFDRHLRRVRPLYHRRRDALLEAMREELPDFVPAGVAAGLHLLAWLPPDVSELALVEAAARRGVGIEALAPHRIQPHERGGVLIGFARSDEAVIRQGTALIANAVTELRGSSPTGT
ncbi:MAG TPA: PLP-dependent aminotransferase family protein [Galbitalea sp.]|jgi:GntR family transcriptional regulator/MocR family aminotransferase|nr:PLP-dependent aminotransferase family protein [Galbitalea sp.]